MGGLALRDFMRSRAPRGGGARSAIGRLVAKRLIGVVALLFVMSFVVFSLEYLEPRQCHQGPDRSTAATAATVSQIRAEYNLNDSFLTQYGLWVTHAITGNFGISVQSRSPVGHEIAARVPLTLELVLLAFVMGAAIALPAGIVAGLRQGKLIDRSSVIASIVFLSAPPFALGLIMLYLFPTT